MKKQTVLNKIEEELILDLCEYLLCDDKERNDFIENFGHTWFNEYEILDLDAVPKDCRNHIYYKTEIIRQTLMEIKYGV